MNSTELIEKAKERFRELEHKNYEWKSFYNGFLEAYSIAVVEFKKCNLHSVMGRKKKKRKRDMISNCCGAKVHIKKYDMGWNVICAECLKECEITYAL